MTLPSSTRTVVSLYSTVCVRHLRVRDPLHVQSTQISIVSQEPVLFAESILYNICFGMPRGTEGVSREQARALTRHLQ